MNHAADTAMFWVGALFVFTPMVFFGIVIGVWWYQQKKRAAQGQGFPGEAGEYSPQSSQRPRRQSGA